MNEAVKKQILDKIKEYDKIMIFRHIRNDGDCVGATKGFKRILELTFPEKEIYVDATCCAGVTCETHNAALTTMKMCQIEVK